MEEKGTYHLIKKILLIGIIGSLFIPMFSNRYKWFQFAPLNGVFTNQDDVNLNLDSWLQGRYQSEKERYIEDNQVLKPLFVRLYNQYYYDFFSTASAKSVEVGKSSFLYEKGYIDTYLGRDFVGYEEIESKVDKLQEVVDTLKTKGVDLIVVLAPGKGSFYPEYITDEFNPENKTTTNYTVYNDQLSKSNIHYLDFNSWFIKQKETATYPLFPKTGIHWSKYGELLAADSIIRFINLISDYKKVPNLLIGDVVSSQVMRDTDDDIEKGMNLMFDIPDLEMAYPAYSFEKQKIKNQPKVLTIADSYYWGMFNFGLSRDAFNAGQFWYYNEAIYPNSYEKPLYVKDINIIEEVEKNDFIILMSTDANLHKFAFGFIDQLYEEYFLKK